MGEKSLEIVNERFLSFQKAAQEKRDQEELDLQRREEGKLIPFPIWPDSKRGTPNSILRGCLFAAIREKDCRYFKREVILDEKNLKIIMTGRQLNQSDLGVWENILHIARIQNFGHIVYFSAYSFLKKMKKHTGLSQHEWLKDTFAKLSSCCVEITHEGKTYFGSLIKGGTRNEVTGEYTIEINPKLARLYTSGWTQTNWEDRLKIGNRPLALWLYGYISSHIELYPTKVETYHRLSGSVNKCLRGFKRHLQEALKELLERDLIKGFFIDERNIVHIQNTPSLYQQKYNDV